jgi:hypothetical protein
MRNGLTQPGGNGLILGTALWAGALVRTAQWDRRLRSRRALRALQLETLRSHCCRAANTEFGRAHDLSAVRSHDDFVRRVPLRRYADYEPYFLRMRRGARDVLWPGFVEHFASSSGTTSTGAAQKLLPITPEQIAFQRWAGVDVLGRYMALTGDRAMLRGYTIHLFPPAVMTQEGAVKKTTNPALMRLAFPAAAQRRSLPEPPIRDIADYDTKLTAIAEAYLDHDVRAVSGTTCWFSLLFDRVLEVARQRGRSVDCVADVWPNLRALFGGGVNAEPYRRLIDERVGSAPVLIDNYNATEGGILAATDRLDEAGMAMFVDRGVFYELVERGEEGSATARRLPLWEAEPGVEYAVHVTTASGLFGYALGDHIRLLSVYPHRIAFMGRTSGVLSLTQERTSHADIEGAVAEAQRAQPCTIVDFAAGPEFGVGAQSQGRYVLYVEFERAPHDAAAFGAAFDAQLGAQNNMYREYRDKDVAILPPRVVPLARGGSRELMRLLGQTSPQCKFPRIVDERRGAILESLVRPPMGGR